MSQTTKQEPQTPPAAEPASSPARTRSASQIDEAAHDREDFLDDDKLEHVTESLEPPIKRLRVELPADGEEGLDGLTGIRVITGAPFDEAWKGTGTQAQYFRANMQEGAKSIMKRLEVNIRHGLALWAKAISALISDGDFFQSREPEKPPPGERPIVEEPLVKADWVIPPPPETEDMIKVTGADLERLTDGLSFVEALSFGTGRGQPRLPLVYVVEESLHIGEVDFYEPTHRIVLCVETLNGETLGPSMVAFMRAILELGAHVRVAKQSLPERPVYKVAAQKIVAEKLVSPQAMKMSTMIPDPV